MQEGWIKLHRKTLETGFFCNPPLHHFWVWCLLKASHKETKISVGYTLVSLKPGQFVFGRLKAAAETGLGEQSIRTSLDYLRLLGNLTLQITSRFTVVTICNWDTYQKDNDEKNIAGNQMLTSRKTGKSRNCPKNTEKKSDAGNQVNVDGEGLKTNQLVTSPVTSCQPAANQVLTTNKNDKNVKNGRSTGGGPQAQVVEFFQSIYKDLTGHEYNAEGKHYILIAKMIRKHGEAPVKEKILILADMCQDGKAWFCKEGPADFTIEKLSSQWNSILRIEKMDEMTASNLRIAKKLGGIDAVRDDSHDKNRRIAGPALRSPGSSSSGEEEGDHNSGDPEDGLSV